MTPNLPLVSPPKSSISPLKWIRKNLFSTGYSGGLTLVSLIFIYWLGSSLLTWTLTQAKWEVVRANLRLFLVGFYPLELLWRPWLTFVILVSIIGLSWGILTNSLVLLSKTALILIGNLAFFIVLLSFIIGISSSLILLGTILLLFLLAYAGKFLKNKVPYLKIGLPILWLMSFIIALWLLLGWGSLKSVRLDDLSGLILTLLVASVSIILSFPFGIILALGRQSSLPVIRWLSTGYIELIRGLPLLGILFMAQVMLPFILPEGIRLDRVVRAIAGFVIFASAYLAENVRGGLQAIPKGQTEAAKALGLNPILTLVFIILPQALRVVIPAIVGQFISLFKDTSLLAIVGLVDLLGISQSILANQKYIGRYAEIYLFLAFIYWCFCTTMAALSRKLEKNKI